MGSEKQLFFHFSHLSSEQTNKFTAARVAMISVLISPLYGFHFDENAN